MTPQTPKPFSREETEELRSFLQSEMSELLSQIEQLIRRKELFEQVREHNLSSAIRFIQNEITGTLQTFNDYEKDLLLLQNIIADGKLWLPGTDQSIPDTEKVLLEKLRMRYALLTFDVSL